MKLKKLLSLCLVGAMAATLLAGCGNSDETVGEEVEDAVDTVVDDVAEGVEDVADKVDEAADKVDEKIDEAAEDVEEKVDDATGNGDYDYYKFPDMVTIDVRALTEYSTDGAEEVIAAMNEISEETINVHADITIMDMSAYINQLSLMLAGGEAFDLVMFSPVDASRFSVMASKSQLMDISELLPEYAPDLYYMMGDFLNSDIINGGLYGVPCYRIYATDMYLIMRQDILDELGLTEQAAAISSWSEMEEIFAAVNEAIENDTLPDDMKVNCVIGNANSSGIVIDATIDNSADDFADDYAFDVLGDSYEIIRADNDGTVKDIWETDACLNDLRRVHQWYENGWVYKDAQVSVDVGGVLVQNGVCFCFLQGSEIGVEAQKKKQTGYDVVCVKTANGIIQTSGGATWGWGVPITSTEPEAACAFLNLLYTSAEMMNLAVYGIEGRDYELNDQGEAVLLDDGVYATSDWMWGNQFLVYPAEDQGGDFREIALEATMDDEISPFYGFNADTDPIVDELVAINSVIDQYGPGVRSGTVDVDEVYDDMIAAFKDAGMDTVIQFYQDALDEWLAEQ